MSRTVEADWTWVDGDFRDGITVEIGDDGRIASVGEAPRESPPRERLHQRALLPGFVNAHSHAFQRGLRGRGERFPQEAGSFWSWREAMYGLVESLDATTLYRWCRQAFTEMRAAGITSLGEFHYLHHDDPEALDFAFDAVVLEAARDSGLRTVLLEAYYRTGGIERELAGGQRRFSTPDPERYWLQMDALAGAAGPLLEFGAVAHSIRAADPGEIAELHAEATRRGLVFHMHLEEQRQEIADCRAAHGTTPLALVASRVAPGASFTAIHATHSTAEDMAAYAANGAGVCLCPLTEANLGDGIATFPLDSVPLSIGTDSNARISVLEELRMLEYAQRLGREQRGAVTTSAGSNASRLLEIATAGGAAALRLDAGRIEPGLWADFALIDLEHPSLSGWEPETLLDTLVFGGGDGAIAGSWVGGLEAPRS